MLTLTVIAVAALAGAAPRPASTKPATSSMVRVGPGIYRPLLPLVPTETEVKVEAYLLDAVPVTNTDYLAFVQRHPSWQRGRVKPIFADTGYLAAWASPTRLGAGAPPHAPVVQVSWFAARAYCRERGARLPLEREWELAAAASETSVDGGKDPAFRARLLAWVTEMAPSRPTDIRQRKPNIWGAYDLQGLVWEWVEDFGSTLMGSDDRSKGDASRERFCGAGAANATDPEDYATFMRLALRSSLIGRDTTSTLGFRCAKDL